MTRPLNETGSIETMDIRSILTSRIRDAGDAVKMHVTATELDLYVAAITAVVYANEPDTEKRPTVDGRVIPNTVVPDDIIDKDTYASLSDVPADRNVLCQILIESIIYVMTSGTPEIYPATTTERAALAVVNAFVRTLSKLAIVNNVNSNGIGYLNYISGTEDAAKHLAKITATDNRGGILYRQVTPLAYRDIEDGIVNAGFTPRDDSSVNAYSAAVYLTLGMMDDAAQYGITLPDTAFILSRKVDALADPHRSVRDEAYKMLISVAVGMITRQKDYVFVRTLVPNTAARILEVFLSYLYKIIALNDLVIATGPLAKQHAEPASRHRFINDVLSSAQFTEDRVRPTARIRPEQPIVPEVIYELLAVAERLPEDRNFLLGTVARYIHEYLDDGVDGTFADFSARDLPR